MSQATKRKHVVKEVLGEHMVPSDQQQIVRVLRTPGNNLHEVETAQGQRFLVSMPSKYRKNIWIKRGERGSLLGDRSVSCGLGFPHHKQDRLCFSLLPLQGTFSSLTLLKKERR